MTSIPPFPEQPKAQRPFALVEPFEPAAEALVLERVNAGGRGIDGVPVTVGLTGADDIVLVLTPAAAEELAQIIGRAAHVSDRNGWDQVVVDILVAHGHTRPVAPTTPVNGALR